MAVTKTIIITSGTSFRVPNTWNSLNNSVICIGGGGGGRTAGNTSGGGGGAYARNVNITLTPDSTISIIIGAGGAASANGGFTSINSGTVNAAGGKSNTSGGGAGGSTSDSTGTTMFAGGRGGNASGLGGGGGGGAGGNTATGNTGNASTGAQDVFTRGGNAGQTGGSQFNGWDPGNSSSSIGNGYGGGGGEGGYAESGKGGGYISGNPGNLFGGGGGGGSWTPAVGGAGGQGGIILSWTYNSKLPDATVAMSMDAVTIALDRTPTSQITLNEGNVRDLFGAAPTDASMISFSGGASKVANGAIVATSNTTGTASTISLPSGCQNGDLAVLFIINAAGGTSPSNSPVVTSSGWTFLGANSRAINTTYGYTTCAFSRVLQTGDLAPTFSQSAGGAFMIAIRNASMATALQANNNQTGANTTFSGFTKNADSKKLITFIADRDRGGGTAPTGWTEHLPRVNLTNFCIQCATVNSASYTNGSNVVWTGFNTAGFGQMGILLEVS